MAVSIHPTWSGTISRKIAALSQKATWTTVMMTTARQSAGTGSGGTAKRPTAQRQLAIKWVTCSQLTAHSTTPACAAVWSGRITGTDAVLPPLTGPFRTSPTACRTRRCANGNSSGEGCFPDQQREKHRSILRHLGHKGREPGCELVSERGYSPSRPCKLAELFLVSLFTASKLQAASV